MSQNWNEMKLKTEAYSGGGVKGYHKQEVFLLKRL